MTHDFWGGGCNLYRSIRQKIRIWGISIRERTKPQKQVMWVWKRLLMTIICCYTHQKMKIIKGYLISSRSSPVHHIWAIKKMFMDKSRENKPPTVFHSDHCSRIRSAILGMKTIYCRKHNIRLVNPKQRAGQWIYLFLFLYV